MKQTGWQQTALSYSFLNLEPICCSIQGSNCCFFTCIQISQETGEMIWYSILKRIFVRAFCSLLWSTQSKAFRWHNGWNRGRWFFFQFPSFLHDPLNVGTLISGSSSFSKSSLAIWKFLVRRMLKPSMQDFQKIKPQKWEAKDEPQSNGSYKISQIIIKIMAYTHIQS